MHFIRQEYKYDEAVPLPYPRLFNLIQDPRERNSVTATNSWV